MKQFIKFPSIEQFRNIVKEVKFLTPENKVLPSLLFNGTVKLHGTNGGIRYDTQTGELWAQSRNKIITPKEDNAGFAAWVDSNKEVIINLINQYNQSFNLQGIITVFGEWCGGNIQKGVGISKLEKMFVIFDVIDDKGNSMPFMESIHAEESRIYNILQFPTFQIYIDFNTPQLCTNELTKLTEQVEEECPVAKYFGVSGNGEGIVWRANYLNNTLRFKVKGDKHSTSKVKKLVQVDPEKLSSIQEFVDYVITDNRMNQAIEQVFTSNSILPDIKAIGNVIKWTMTDVFKEEQDTLNSNNLTTKDVTKSCVAKIRKWFIAYLDSNL